MAYLGNDLQVAYPTYKNIDDISGSFNSSTTSFPLRVNGVAPVPPPLNSQQCLISVGGVVQRPDDSGSEGFRLSGGNIIFASAPTTGADFFGVILAGADYVNAGGAFPAGSGSVPSITFAGDTDTGFFNYAPNEIGFGTGGVHHLTLTTAGQLAHNSGTAAAPSYSFTGDLNTGIYRPGADQIAISTNGTGRLFVNSTGLVGIGTSAVTNLLHLRSDSASAVDHLYLQNRNGGASSGARIAFSNGAVDYTDNRYAYIGALNTGATENGNVLVFATNANGQTPVERMRLTATGLAIGTTTPFSSLHVSKDSANPTVNLTRTSNSATTLGESVYLRMSDNWAAANSRMEIGMGYQNSSGTVVYPSAVIGYVLTNGSGVTNGDIYFATRTATTDTAPIERARIDSSGRLLVGTSTARTNFFNTTQSANIQLEGTSGTALMSLVSNADSSGGNPGLILGKTRGTSVGATTIVQSGDTIGRITFQGSDGTEFVQAADITAEVDGTPGANDMPGRLVFSTTADGASSPTERMRIHENGGLSIGTTSKGASVTDSLGIQLGTSGVGGFGQFIRDGGALLQLNRRTNDGDLVIFYQDNAQEGSISVSGTTVSYNGAHLSRWSQLPSGAERTEILRGTVLSNIDEMCEWGDEDNEQLNRMKVSDVDGDKNVSGVFQAWDDDDDTYTNDFYCAMTGDFIIRIAQGVTVERGDLLMSAGDGTAKPQGDGYVQDKTVAKVTSTHITCTYDDGSYCVPCVLMAC